SRLVEATVVEEHTAYLNNVPAIVGLSPAAVTADVEAGPIIDRSNHRKRPGVSLRLRRKVRRDSRCRHCNKTQRAQQKFLHRIFSGLNASPDPKHFIAVATAEFRRNVCVSALRI